MANTSTKNFPHAYGAGRCIAAFSLSHPGGPREVDSAELGCPPPGLDGSTYPSALAGFPAASDVTTEDSPGVYTRRIGYVPDHQPLNATSFGVYATGSGTKRLPYRDAIAPFVPDPAPGDPSIAPVAAPLLPQSEGNIKRPFGIVDDAKLGDSSAQALVRLTEPAPPGDAPPLSDPPEVWYDVGLDWTIPDQILGGAVVGGAPYDVLPEVEKWASDQAASVRKALARTMWVTATVAVDALSEPVPGVSTVQSFGIPADSVNALLQGAVSAVPQPRNAIAAPGAGTTAVAGMQAPYSMSSPILSDGSAVPPFSPRGIRRPFVNPPASANVIAARNVAARASIEVLITGVSLAYSAVEADGTLTADSVASGRMSLVPVVRVWSLFNGPGVSLPRGIPRLGYAPTNGVELDFMPGAIEVHVFQKNSSATDGTDAPVYDLYNGWADLGTGV